MARREHSRKELKNKLTRRCKDEMLIGDLLDTLSGEGLQCDKRFTESFVHHCINKGQGPNKIIKELRQRGIEQGIIEQYFESQYIDWMSLAEKIRVKKYGESKILDYQTKAKQSRFLYSRGFSSEHINQLLK